MYTVYAKLHHSNGNTDTLSASINIDRRYSIHFKVGLQTMWTEKVEPGDSVTIPAWFEEEEAKAYDLWGKTINYCSYDFREGDFRGWYSDPAATQLITSDGYNDYTFVPSGNMDIYVLYSPFSSSSFLNDHTGLLLIEKKELLDSLGLEFVSGAELSEYGAITINPQTNIHLDNNGNVIFENKYYDYDFIVTYRNVATGMTFNVRYGFSGCLVAGTEVLVEEEEEDKKGRKKKKRKKKKIEDITYDDNLVVWDFEHGCETTAKPLWIMNEMTSTQYICARFSDGSELKAVTNHRIFNVDSNQFTYLLDDVHTPIGTHVYKEDGSVVQLVDVQIVEEEVKYYNVITKYHMNMFANDFLTSFRLNNIYPIEDMKFIKDDRELSSREEFDTIPDEFYEGLRLAEQPKEINRDGADPHTNTLKEYVERLLVMMKPKK